jgi:hypothetical protein
VDKAIVSMFDVWTCSRTTSDGPSGPAKGQPLGPFSKGLYTGISP